MLLSTACLLTTLMLAPSRGNDVLQQREGPVFSVVAAARLGVLLAGGADVIQPLGFGAGLSFRVHALHIGPIRFGGGVDLGHTRVIDRREVTGVVGEQPQTATRYAALAHTDFTAGPSVQVVLGPMFVQGDLTIGLGVHAFSRPLGPLSIDEEMHSDVSAMLRAGGLIGVPIRNNQGLTLGAGMLRYFSTYQLVAEPDLAPDATPSAQTPDTNPFDLMVDVTLGYLFMF